MTIRCLVLAALTAALSAVPASGATTARARRGVGTRDPAPVLTQGCATRVAAASAAETRWPISEATG